MVEDLRLLLGRLKGLSGGGVAILKVVFGDKIPLQSVRGCWRAAAGGSDYSGTGDCSRGPAQRWVRVKGACSVLVAAISLAAMTGPSTTGVWEQPYLTVILGFLFSSHLCCIAFVPPVGW